MGKVDDDFDSDRFGTPREVVKLLDAYWPEGVGLDPCWDEDCIIRPDQAFCLRPKAGERGAHDEGFGTVHYGVDATSVSWSAALKLAGKASCYGNFPYSGPAALCRKAACEAREWPELDAVLLLRVAVGSNYWREWIWPHATAVGFVSQPRICFLKRGKAQKQAGQYDNAFVLMAGHEARRLGARDRFRAVFGPRCAKIVD